MIFTICNLRVVAKQDVGIGTLEHLFYYLFEHKIYSIPTQNSRCSQIILMNCLFNKFYTL